MLKSNNLFLIQKPATWLILPNETLESGPISLHGPMGYPLHIQTATWLILPVIQELIHVRNPKLTDSYLVGPASNSGANTCTKPRIYVPGLCRFEVIDSSGFKGFPDFLDLFLCCIALLGGPNS